MSISALEARADAFTPWQGDPPAAKGAFQVTRLPHPIKPAVPMTMLDMLALRLSQAERPLFVFGGGAAQAGGPNGPVVSVLAKCRAASICTYSGRGVVPPDTLLFLGSNLARPGSAALLGASDCVVVVGTDLAEVDLWRQTSGLRPGAAHINIDPEVLARAHPRDETLQYDALDALAALDAALIHPPKSGWSQEIVAGFRDRFRAEVAAERPGILPVADALRSCLPPGTMIYSDMTQFAYAAKEVWDMERPGHWHHPTGFGTLGYALPAAIGGAVARRGLPTMAIAGDYGFQYTLQELATAVELGLSLPIILWDNDGLGEIADSMTRAQIAPNAVSARNPDFVKLAQAYGAHAAQPATLAEMQDTVRTAFAAPVPTLIRLRPGLA